MSQNKTPKAVPFFPLESEKTSGSTNILMPTLLASANNCYVAPVHAPTLTNTWNLILNYHIYEADALQITTCNFGDNTALITSDKKMAQTSKKTGITTILLPGDEEALKALIWLSHQLSSHFLVTYE